jgi:hypothetical protein
MVYCCALYPPISITVQMATFPKYRSVQNLRMVTEILAAKIMPTQTSEICKASFSSEDCTGFIKFKTVPPGGKGKGGGAEDGIKFQP